MYKRKYEFFFLSNLILFNLKLFLSTLMCTTQIRFENYICALINNNNNKIMNKLKLNTFLIGVSY